jgi:hypothetical protein
METEIEVKTNEYYQNLYEDLALYKKYLKETEWEIKNFKDWLEGIEKGEEGEVYDKQYEQMVRDNLKRAKLIKAAIENQISLITSILNEAKAEIEEQSN